MFDDDEEERPAVTWSQLSFELKGTIAYSLVMFVLVFVDRFAFAEVAWIAAAMAGFIALVAVVRRVRHGWRWPGLSALRLLATLLLLVVFSYFALFKVVDAFVGFLYLSAYSLRVWGLALFVLLYAFRIVHLTERDFRAECRDPLPAEPEIEREPPAPRPRWKTALRWSFLAVFLALWLEAMASFYVVKTTYDAAAPQPTAVKTERLVPFGDTVFVTPAEKRLVDLLLIVMQIGFAFLIALWITLRLLFGVDLRFMPD